ncbi:MULTISPECIES: LysR family transcriptional regulator [unclassified Roseateles]|jgi:LysR family transcriptional regulator for metE and metH|uniref:LysR family transcriptional regulator n=1 Tax=unclassified Roseateles TaxID=2626991 RepID=UPI001612D5E5|nr:MULTISPECIES: LysR family transcriptional regulator [unclassified Roseateles]MBB3281840.1 LysR family transcriptional regulator for metE and metH [Mitsuaria sp. BK037]MBB3293887.1 LysR family transcriptional regulator for metE and metH [Mitsuaria sp. BK041]MBB3363104.1 LysR family transcriptional regulator for metE and metH [Mitsuaria sp. BK045]
MQTPLELRHLRTLLALREAGNLSRAAQLLNLTQSALSHQLKGLEDHYGTELFERKSSPLSFGVAGQRLLKLAELVLPQIDEADRDVRKLVEGSAGQLRIAVECHTCFDWLMPAMDAFRERWPEVELDIVSGFQADPVGLLHQDRAELAIVSDVDAEEAGVAVHPLFSFEIVALLPKGHPLLAKPWLEAEDFAAQAYIHYPVPDEMLDLVRSVLKPAGVTPPRRTSELTVAMLQLVASGRGFAALPLWAVEGYLARGYVARQRIGPSGLTGRLYAVSTGRLAAKPFLADFVRIMRETSLVNLGGVSLL